MSTSEPGSTTMRTEFSLAAALSMHGLEQDAQIMASDDLTK